MPGKERHGRLLHPASSYISVWENFKAASGSSIADYVYTCVTVWLASSIVWTDDFHLDIKGIFRCPKVFTGAYSVRT